MTFLAFIVLTNKLLFASLSVIHSFEVRVCQSAAACPVYGSIQCVAKTAEVEGGMTEKPG